MDPAERERERKSSQQRITAIVHAVTTQEAAAANLLQTETGQDPFDPGEEEFLDSLVASVTSSKKVCTLPIDTVLATQTHTTAFLSFFTFFEAKKAGCHLGPHLLYRSDITLKPTQL